MKIQTTLFSIHNTKMKLFLIIGGFFILIFTCIVPLKEDIQEYDVQQNGVFVRVTITYIPICLGTKTSPFMKFKYDGTEYAKRVGCNFPEFHNVGEIITLKHIDNTDIFLFENEKKETEFIATGLLGILGIIFIIKGVRKK